MPNPFLTKELAYFDEKFPRLVEMGTWKSEAMEPHGLDMKPEVKAFIAQSHARLIAALTEEVKGKELNRRDQTNAVNIAYQRGYNAALTGVANLLKEWE